MHKVIGLTKKWELILQIISRANEDGSFVDLDQILDRMNRGLEPNGRGWTTKDNIQFMLRSLIERNFIEKVGMAKRRGARRRLYAATSHGFEVLNPGEADFRNLLSEMFNDLDL